MQADYTEIAFILDRSGSMLIIKNDAIGGFNGFVEDQQKQPGRANLSLVIFDDKYEAVHQSVPLPDVPVLTDEIYVPRGYTALYDAIGRTVTDLGKRLAAMPEDDRPGKVIIAIMTDGQENASQEYTLDTVSAMIKHQTEIYGWHFLFLGSNIDVVAYSTALNIPAVNAVAFESTSKGTEAAYRSVTASVNVLRTGK